MEMHVKAPSGSWVQPSAVYVQDGGAWRRVTSLLVNDGDTEPEFREFYSYDPSRFTEIVAVTVSTPPNGPLNVNGQLTYFLGYGEDFPASYQRVTLWADDELVQSTLTGHAGAFQFSWDPPAPGSYDLRVEYEGVGDYTPASYEMGNHIVTGTATISVSWPSVFLIGEPVTLRPKATSPMPGVSFSDGTMRLQRQVGGEWSTMATGTWNGDGWDVTWTAEESIRGAHQFRLQLTGVPGVTSVTTSQVVIWVEFAAPPPANLTIHNVTTYYTYFSIAEVPGVAYYEIYCHELGKNVYVGPTQFYRSIETLPDSVYTFTVMSVSATGLKTTGNTVRVSTVYPPSWDDAA